jgi:two-component system OmpR family sensor kinase
VRPLLEEINRLLARLAAALDAQRAFVADAAHELRTPLTTLSLQVQLAERAGSATERDAAFAQLRRGLKRANRLIEQLLTLARREIGVVEHASVPLDLLALAQEVVAERAAVATTQGIDLGVVGETAVTVHGDWNALYTLLGNLVDNALHYTPRGGRVDVEPRLQTGSGAALLQVRDTGPGIPAEERERVFARFYRRPGSGGTGSGLGLAIVSSIAAHHGATIQLADPEEGPGLVVTVTFPPDGPCPHS